MFFAVNCMDRESMFLVTEVKRYLKDNVYNEVCLREVCEHVNMSKSFVCDTFRKGTGYGIIEYYRALKVGEAKRLIREKEWNMTRIAKELQYMSVHQFSRSFKRQTGISPIAYRKMLEESKKMERNT